MLTNIDHVVARLTEIVDSAKREKARYGYFACLYLEMTRAVQKTVRSGSFGDSSQMERLCVIFAGRYIEAYDQWRSGQKPSASWDVAFAETRKSSICVIQHLLCGMNAHINLDLGIASALTREGTDILPLKKDFDAINAIIASLMNVMKARLHKVSWPIKFLDDFGKNYDDSVANFSICIARDEAWRVAVELHSKTKNDWPAYIQHLDGCTRDLAYRIINPGFMANLVLGPIRWFEPSDTGKILTVLSP